MRSLAARGIAVGALLGLYVTLQIGAENGLGHDVAAVAIGGSIIGAGIGGLIGLMSASRRRR